MSDAVRYARTWLQGLTGIAVVGASVMAPWTFGCIHPGFHLGLIILIAIAAICWIPLLLTNQLPRALSAWHLTPLLLVAAVCLFQLVRLPQPILQLASPSAAAIQSELVPASREVDAIGAAVPATPWSAAQRISLYPAETWKQTTWFFAVVTLFVIVQTTTTTKTVLRLLFALTINGAILAFIAIATFLSLDKTRLVTWEWSWGEFTFGNFLNRNHFAFYMNICFGAGLGVWLSRYRQVVSQGCKPTNDTQLILLSTAMVTMLTSLLVCESRGGISSTLFASVAVGIYVFRDVDLRWSWMRIGMALAALSLLVVAFSYWIDGTLFEFRVVKFLSGNQVVDVGRVGLWQRLSSLVVKFPLFGTGVGTIPYVEPFTREQAAKQIVKYAHNDYLQLLIETGVFGFAGIALFLTRLGCCSSKVKEHFNKNECDTGRLGVGILFALAAAAFHSIVDFSIRMPGVAAVVVVLAACLVAFSQFASKPMSTNGARHAAWVRGAMAGGVALAMFLSVWQVASLKNATDSVAQFDALSPSAPSRTAHLANAVKAYPARADWQLLLAEQLADADEISNSERLAIIQRHSIAARDLCPIFSPAQADLAQLSQTFASAASAEFYLQRARIAHPTSETLLFATGIHQLHLHDKATAISFFRRSLALSDTHLHDILLTLSRSHGCTEFDLETVLPDDADRLHRASQIMMRMRAEHPLLASESLRISWLRRACEQLGHLANTADNSKQIYRRAQIAAAIGREEQAIADFHVALSLAPNDKLWRFQFAKYLVSTNRLTDAQTHLRQLVRMDKHPQAETLLRKISTDRAKHGSS